MLVYVCLGVIEGGTAGVMVRALFAQQVPALLVDLVLAMVTSAPAWSNIASLIYARRAQGRPKIAFLQPLLFAMCVCVALLGVLPGGTLGLLLFFAAVRHARGCCGPASKPSAPCSGASTIRAGCARGSRAASPC